MKKLIPALLGLAIVICIATFFSQLKDAEIRSEINLTTSVPNSAFLLIESNHPKSLYSNLKDSKFLWNGFNQSRFNQLLPKLIQNTEAEEEFSGPSTLSFHIRGKNTLDYLIQIYATTPSVIIDSLKKHQQTTITNYEGISINELSVDSSSFYYCKYDKHRIILASGVESVKEFIRWNEADIDESKLPNHWLKLRSTRGKKEVGHIYIQPNKWKQFQEEIFSHPLLFPKAFATNSCLDVKLGTDHLRLAGISEPTKDHPAYFSQGAPSIIPGIVENLPREISHLNWRTITSWNDYLSLYEHRNFNSKLVENWRSDQNQDLNSAFGLEFADFTLDGSEIVCVNQEGKIPEKWKTKSQDKYRGIAISEVKPELYQLFMPQAAPSNLWYTNLNGLHFFSESKEILKDCIDRVISGKTLKNWSTFQDLKSEINLTGSYIKLVFDNSYTGDNQQLNSLINSTQYGVAVFSYLKGIKFYEEVLYKFGLNEEKPDHFPIWTYNLESELHLKPLAVKNHYTSENEILISDRQGVIQLLSKGGRQIFKKNVVHVPLRYPIQIDRYKNGKLQYFFNTKNSLELIARNGNDVHPFPVRSNTDFTSPALVVDYDLDKDYRIIVAAGKEIRNYSLDGKPTKGWKNFTTENVVVQKPHYLRIGNKDYLIVIDQGGLVYVLNRRGSIRYKNSVKLTEAIGEYYIIKGSDISSTRIEYVNAKGHFITQYLNGKVNSTVKKEFSSAVQASRVKIGARFHWAVLADDQAYILNDKLEIVFTSNDIKFPFIETGASDYPIILNSLENGTSSLLSKKFELSELENEQISSALVTSFVEQGEEFNIISNSEKVKCLSIPTKK